MVQVALALTLLVGSGLAVRSFQRLAAVDPGFDPVDVLAFGLSLPERDYESPACAAPTSTGRLSTVCAPCPASVDASAASTVPLSGEVSGSGHSIEGRPLADDEVPPVFMVKRVAPGVLRRAPYRSWSKAASSTRLDGEREAPVAIVSRSLARTHWPGESALGKGIRLGGPPDEEGEQWSRVVGVVDDVHELNLHEDPPEMAYYPLPGDHRRRSRTPAVMRYLMRGAERGGAVGRGAGGGARARPHPADAEIETLEILVGRARGERAFVMILLAISAGLALLLGSVGLYGVVSYMVAQRRREIAVRMAVGAQVADVRRLVLTEAGGLALLGALLGIGAAVALTRRLQALLFETSPLDPLVFVAVSTLLVGVCLLASWLPARRAARIEPLAALRAE